MTSDAPSLLARLSVSLPADLLVELDAMVAERGLPSRSQMIAELIRHELAEHSGRTPGDVVAGAITLIYRAERGRARDAIARAQIGYVKEIISSQHVFLEEDQSMEVMLVQGPAGRLHQLCDELRRLRCVAQIKLVTTTALLPPLHGDAGAPASRGRAR